MQHLFDHRLLGTGFEFEVQKTRAGNVDAFNPLAECRRGHEGGAQGFTHLSGVLSQGFGQVHGGRAGQVAMGGDLGGFKSGLGAGTRVQAFEFGGEGRK